MVLKSLWILWSCFYRFLPCISLRIIYSCVSLHILLSAHRSEPLYSLSQKPATKHLYEHERPMKPILRHQLQSIKLRGKQKDSFLASPAVWRKIHVSASEVALRKEREIPRSRKKTHTSIGIFHIFNCDPFENKGSLRYWKNDSHMREMDMIFNEAKLTTTRSHQTLSSALYGTHTRLKVPSGLSIAPEKWDHVGGHVGMSVSKAKQF